MAVLEPDMESNSDKISNTSSYYRPSEDDFARILDRLKARRLRSRLEFSISPTCLDEENETKQEKQQRLRQEAQQRDQYILSMRPNRHVVFAAKFAKIKNQGLAKRYERQVNIWSQEMQRKCRLAGANEKAIKKELVRVRKMEKPRAIPRASYPSEKLKNSRKRHAKQHNLKLPKLEGSKDESYARRGSSKSNGHDTAEKVEFGDTSVRLPPIKILQTQKDTE